MQRLTIRKHVIRLAARNYSKLLQRLTEIRNELTQMQQVYAEMYRSALTHRAQIRQITANANAAIVGIMQQTNAHTRPSMHKQRSYPDWSTKAYRMPWRYC